jgi:hypothetical protein
MPVHSQIVDGKGDGYKAKVSPAGELVTAPYEYSEPVFINLAVDDQGYTFFKPLTSQRFVITDIIAFADKNVTTDCIIDIYEADAEDSATIAKSILKLDLLKQDKIVLTGLNFITSDGGKFVNGKTDDNNALVTIAGYYVPVEKIDDFNRKKL